MKDCFKMLEAWWMPSEGLKGGLPIRGLRLRFTNERTNSSDFYLHSGRDNSTIFLPATGLCPVVRVGRLTLGKAIGWRSGEL